MEKPNIQFWKKPLLKWTNRFSQNSYQIKEPCFEASAKLGGYFASALAEPAMEVGKQYYFEVTITGRNAGESYEVKLGVSQGRRQDDYEGFSSEKTGWGFYLRDSGERRNGGNSGTISADGYGNHRYQPGEILGVYVDLTDEGYIGFSVNGKWLGKMYSVENGFNVSQPVYAAVS